METSTQHKNREEEIIFLLSRQDEEGLRKLYKHYAHALKGVLFKIVLSEETAEDLLQDTFVKIWNNFHSFDKRKGRLFTWMLNIARNLAIDKIRSPKYQAIQKTDDIDDYVYAIDKSENESYQPEHIGVKAVVETLKPELREVINLIYFLGYTQSEVAEKLDIPLGTVKTRIRSGVIEMRKYFK
ncbi:MAG: RNA polymerase sigma factor [Bacteroidetes bacterium]|nr:RNA polymerase sigma factor [Bacteroidota bacterium]